MHQRSASGCCVCPLACPGKEAGSPVLPAPFPAGDTALRIGFGSQTHGAHGYEAYPHPDEAPNPECEYGNRSAVQTPHKTPGQCSREYPGKPTAPSCRSGRYSPPGRSCCFSGDPLRSGCVPCDGFSRSGRFELPHGRRNAPNNTSVRFLQSCNPADPGCPGMRGL